jgi:phosphopantetheinyl transferase
MRASTPRIELALAQVSLARLRRHEAWLTERYVQPDDRALASRLVVKKRRVDFLGGRIAARRACAGLGLPSTTRVAIETGEREGAPYLVDERGTRLAAGASISHAADWAVAAVVASGRVGVDLERVEPRHPALVEEAFGADELAGWRTLLRAEPEPLVITLAWCAKEACLKLRGTGLRTPLPAFAVRPREWLDHSAPEKSGMSLPSAATFGADALRWLAIECDGRAGRIGFLRRCRPRADATHEMLCALALPESDTSW